MKYYEELGYLSEMLENCKQKPTDKYNDPDRVEKMQALKIAIDAVRKMGKNADCYEGSVTIGIK